jgi:transposase-like protein
LDQRLQFLSSYQKEEMSVADLCRAYGISRPTAYRWINRYNETGPEGLVDRSRRPHIAMRPSGHIPSSQQSRKVSLHHQAEYLVDAHALSGGSLPAWGRPLLNSELDAETFRVNPSGACQLSAEGANPRRWNNVSTRRPILFR